MIINGVEILKQSIIYIATWYGNILLLFFLVGGALIAVTGGLWDDIKIMILGTTICVSTLILIPFATSSDFPTFLNKPYKIQYIIEIKDDSAWKEIGPNYKVIKKIYDNKEIYLVEGDYIDD